MGSKMLRRGRVFTPTVIEIIRKLAAEGKTASEIAASIGSTAASVRVKCSEHKISLRRGRPGPLQGRSRRRQDEKLIVYLRPALYAALKRKADDRRKTAVGFAAMLLEAIVSSDIYEAVLDDGA
jgi:hypothetical protein